MTTESHQALFLRLEHHYATTLEEAEMLQRLLEELVSYCVSEFKEGCAEPCQLVLLNYRHLPPCRFFETGSVTEALLRELKSHVEPFVNAALYRVMIDWLPSGKHTTVNFTCCVTGPSSVLFTVQRFC